MFLPRVNSCSEKCSLTFVGPKVWSSIPDCIKLSATFTFNSYRIKIHKYVYILATFTNQEPNVEGFSNLHDVSLFFMDIYFFVSHSFLCISHFLA